MDYESVIRIGELTLRANDCEGFSVFFENIRKSNRDFIVLIARRCFALYEIYGHKPSEKSKIISSNALLLYADVFAERYRQTGRFPTVLLADDLLLYGRSIRRLLYRFEKLIIEALEKRQGTKLSSSDLYYLDRDLMSSIAIYVYAIDKFPRIVDGLYKRQIIAETRRYSDEIKEMSLSISKFIEESLEPNTSYRHSVCIAEDIKLGNCATWEKISHKYRGENRNIYFDKDNNNSNFYSFVYTHGEGRLNSTDSKWLTGMAVWGDISRAKFDLICDKACQILEKYNEDSVYNFLIKTLRYKHGDLQSQRAQLISFMLSAIAIKKFCKEQRIAVNDAFKEKNEPHLKHIATNFGLYKDVWRGIEQIANDPILLDQLEKILHPEINASAQVLLANNNTATLGDADENSDAILSDAFEMVFQRIGYEADKEAIAITDNKKTFRPKEIGSDIIALRESLYRTCDSVRSKASTLIFSTEKILAGLTMIFDSGITALNFIYNEDADSIVCALKTGELSNFSLPRKFHWFIPAFAWIEQEFYPFGISQQQLVKEFIQYLGKTGIKDSDDFPAANKEEIEAFNLLKECGCQYVDALNECDQIFGDWNFELLTFGDWRENSDPENPGIGYYRYLTHNTKRREYYLNEARRFIKNKHANS